MPNQLIHETSPYLLQHAHNPVNWHAWNEKVFAKAKKEDKPVLVSIGYSTCHWCHVMERESFEDEDVAAFMNEHFINIKVDREERPDVDQVYMEVCQIINGNGGWPLNVFLLPDGRPFMAGTYYPPQPFRNRPSWMQVLHHIHHSYKDKKEMVEAQARRITEILKKPQNSILDSKINLQKDSNWNAQMLDAIYEKLESTFDTEEGGFGKAPKFPGAMTIDFLMTYHHFSGNSNALAHALFSLEKMIRGGIYDQLGGGFARYATDRAWLIPHFEKMLYDNALIAGNLADAYRIAKKPIFKNSLIETLDWVQGEMLHPQGGFYSALDADSEGEEGKYYLWSKAEVADILGAHTELFSQFYDVSEKGNWNDKNILNRKFSLDAFCKKYDRDKAETKQILQTAKQQLLRERKKRLRPGLDDKILLDWNSLMITAFAKAAKALQDETYIHVARKCVDFIFKNLIKNGGPQMWHTYKDGQPKYDAYLDDYAFLTEAMIEMYESTFDEKYLLRAKELTDFAIDEFFDTGDNLFYFAGKSTELIVRKKEIYDNAMPSGNATMALNLQQLSIFFDNRRYSDIAANMLEKIHPGLITYPGTFAKWAKAFVSAVHPIREIAVTGPQAFELCESIQAAYVPNKVIMAATNARQDWPLLKGKMADQNQTNIFLCQQYACQKPVQSADAFFDLIS